MQQVHTAEGATEAVGARDDRRRYGSCRRVRRPAALRKLSARETTGRATEAAGAGQAGPARSETSGASHRTSDASAGRARPARSETSGAGHRTSDASAGRAETGRQGETSGESCRTSQGPAVPRDECGRKRISHLGRRLRESARRKSQTLGGPQYKQREGIRGRPNSGGPP